MITIVRQDMRSPIRMKNVFVLPVSEAARESKKTWLPPRGRGTQGPVR